MQAKCDRPSGFTIVEVIVIIAIITLLTALILPAMKGARTLAAQTNAASGLRQMVIGYSAYRADHRGNVMLGYPPPTVNGEATVVTTVSGHDIGWPVASRYPWRLGPYVDEIWEIVHSHREQPPQGPAAGDDPGTAGSKAYSISLGPAFGLNSVFVGGHNGPSYQGYVGDQPNTNAHVVFRNSDVNRASEMIIFAESQMYTTYSMHVEQGPGFFMLMPPNANGQKWTTVDGSFALTSASITGLPKGRYNERAITSFYDGHLEFRTPDELNDMRLWYNDATHADDDFSE